MSYSHQNHNQSRFNNHRGTTSKPQFIEDRSKAFFLGKLNKHHDREKVYCQLKRLTRTHDFYIAKFDMPNGMDGRGNKGFAFVHTNTTEQARRIIAMGHLKLGNQMCEVKSYGGRTDAEMNSSGRGSPDSGVNAWNHSSTQPSTQPSTKPSNFTNNPLKNHAPQFDTRSRLNSGIRSDSGMLSDCGSKLYADSGKFSRNISESESIQKEIPLESVLSHQENNIVKGDEQQHVFAKTNYEPSNISVNETDQWLDQQTSYLMNNLNGSNWNEFTTLCDYFLGVLQNLQNSDSKRVEEVIAIQNGTMMNPVHV